MAEILQFGPDRALLRIRIAAALIFAVFPAIIVSIPLLITGQRVVTIVAAAVAVYALFVLLRIAYLRAHFETIRFELDAHHLTNAEGLFWRVRRMTPLDKVTNVDVRQGPLDRRFGIGNIWVFTPSTGALTPEAMLVGVASPHDVRARIVELAEQARMVSPTAGAAQAARDGEAILEEMLLALRRIETLLSERL